MHNENKTYLFHGMFLSLLNIHLFKWKGGGGEGRATANPLSPPTCILFACVYWIVKGTVWLKERGDVKKVVGLGGAHHKWRGLGLGHNFGKKYHFLFLHRFDSKASKTWKHTHTKISVFCRYLGVFKDRLSSWHSAQTLNSFGGIKCLNFVNDQLFFHIRGF